MSDLISRQDAIAYLIDHMIWFADDGYEVSEKEKVECVTELINGVPSARPKGHWIKESYIGWRYECPLCGHVMVSDEELDFCPSCGVDMRGEEHG